MMKIRMAQLLCFSLVIFGANFGVRAEMEIDPIQPLMTAFNDHDAAAMVQWMDPEVAWFYVSGDQLQMEAKGTDAMLSSMQNYFKSVPTVKSEITQRMDSPPYVTVREVVSWVDKEGNTRSQSSLAVYELKDGKILAVWYYPVQP